MSIAAPGSYNRAMPGMVTKAALLALALIVATSATAQTRRRHATPEAEPERGERAIPPPAVDKRDSMVTGAGAANGRLPYWAALAQCGGIYFKLNTFYTDAAVHARVVKPDPRANDEFTRKLNEAIKTATIFFDGAEHFLMTERNLERADAVLIYDGQSRAASDRLKSIDAALAAAKTCPALYQSCKAAHPKECNETLPPMSRAGIQGLAVK